MVTARKVEPLLMEFDPSNYSSLTAFWYYFKTVEQCPFKCWILEMILSSVYSQHDKGDADCQIDHDLTKCVGTSFLYTVHCQTDTLLRSFYIPRRYREHEVRPLPLKKFLSEYVFLSFFFFFFFFTFWFCFTGLDTKRKKGQRMQNVGFRTSD